MNASKNTPRTQISVAMTVGHASVLMALMIAFSRLTGFGRLMVTSHLYGRNATTDAYNAAFNIPDTISILIAGGALATGFVPVFTTFLSRGDEAAARRTFRAMWTLLGAAFGALTVVLFLLTFTPIGVAVARAQAPLRVELYLELLRVLLAAQFFFVLGGLFAGTLNALRLFWYPALQPVFFNVGIIIFGIAGPKFFGAGIESQAWGAFAGAIVGSILLQIPALMRNGLSLRPLWNPRDEGVQKVLASLLPIIFGLASGQIIALNLPRFLAGSIEGDLSALDYANRLMQLPLAVLASGPAIALYPTLSLLAAEGKRDEMRAQLAQALRRTLLLTLLATALLLALRVPVLQVLLQHGKFTRADTQFTATVLAAYCFGILGLSAQQLLARGFYALGDNHSPIGIGLAAMGAFFVCGALSRFIFQGGAVGLAVSASIATSVLGLWLWWSLRRKLGGWDDGASLQVLSKGTVAALVSYGATALALKYLQAWPLLALCGAGALGVLVFIIAARLLGIKEIEALTRKLTRRGKMNQEQSPK